MITLFQPPAAWGLSSISPFCVKVELYLKMVGLPYQTGPGNPRRAPKGKVPWIDDDGQRIADSGDIIDHLKRRYGDPLDGQLSPEATAKAHLARRCLEEHLLWVLAYTRWCEPAGLACIEREFRQFMPPLLGTLMIRLVLRRVVIRRLAGHGLGVHTRDEIYRRGHEDLAALATMLGDQPYFLGDQPTSIDASLYAMIASLWRFPGDNPIKQVLQNLPNLLAHTDRMHARYFE